MTRKRPKRARRQGTKRRQRPKISFRRVVLTAARLNQIPADERVLLVQLAQVHNTVNLLRRWVLAASKGKPSGPEQRAGLARRAMASRFLAGTLNEAWSVLRKSYLSTGFAKSYYQELRPVAQRAQQKLKEYFGRPNAIRTVRNKFAFHLDAESIRAELGKLRAGEEFDLFVSEDTGNSLYLVGDTVATLALLTELGAHGPGDFGEKLKAFYDDILEVSSAIDTLVGEILGVMVVRHLPAESWERAEQVHLDAPPIDSLELPYFVSRPRASKRPPPGE